MPIKHLEKGLDLDQIEPHSKSIFESDGRGKLKSEDPHDHMEEVEIKSSLLPNDGFSVLCKVNFREIYPLTENTPDYYNYAIKHPKTIKDTRETEVENDPYLEGLAPNVFFADSLGNHAEKYKDWKGESGFSKETMKYTPFVREHQPRHGLTEGGKGLAFYMKPVVMHTTNMSSIVCVNISYGCPASCSFCKEANIARNFTQMPISEATSIIRVTFGHGDMKKKIEVPAKIKVRFFDSRVGSTIYGPLSVAIANEFPIDCRSLERIYDGEFFRVMSD